MNIKKLKDPGSAITHFIAMVLALLATIPLILKSISNGHDLLHIFSFIIFIFSMILLYGASATYHSFDISEKTNKVLRKLDHAMIFVLIAGSYTPVCVNVITGSKGLFLLVFVWTFALIGICFKMFWITCPHWLSSTIYIAMGWLCIFAISTIFHNLTHVAFFWLVLGGLIYTVGGVIYALKLSLFNTKHKHFGSHEIFHLFCMGGSFCHFILVYFYLI